MYEQCLSLGKVMAMLVNEPRRVPATREMVGVWTTDGVHAKAAHTRKELRSLTEQGYHVCTREEAISVVRRRTQGR